MSRDRFERRIFADAALSSAEVWLTELPAGIVELSLDEGGADANHAHVEIGLAKVRELRLALTRLERLLRDDPLPAPSAETS